VGDVLGGGSGFGILGCPDCFDNPMTWLGKTPGIEQAQNCTEFFNDRRWSELDPDWSHAFLTSQKGTPEKDDFTYVSAALTRDCNLGVCYYPGEIGSQTNALYGTTWIPFSPRYVKDGEWHGRSLARWYDPTMGPIKQSARLRNSGLILFITPLVNSRGDFDWVLVLEKA